jgi:hypothetical protein
VRRFQHRLAIWPAVVRDPSTALADGAAAAGDHPAIAAGRMRPNSLRDIRMVIPASGCEE